jgi:hypothetical protein
VSQSAANTTTLTSTAFTPADNEIIVVKAATGDSSLTVGTASGGSLTYTARVTGSTASYGRVSILTAPVGASPGSMTVALTFSGTGQWHAMVVERWSNAQLAATPATVSTTQSAATAPSATLTTAAADSAVSWVITDWSATAPGTRAYRSSATEESVHDGSTTQYVAYFAWQSAVTAGAQTIGLTAPTMKPAIGGIEIQSGAGVVAAVNPWLTTGDAVRRHYLRG